MSSSPSSSPPSPPCSSPSLPSSSFSAVPIAPFTAPAPMTPPSPLTPPSPPSSATSPSATSAPSSPPSTPPLHRPWCLYRRLSRHLPNGKSVTIKRLDHPSSSSPLSSPPQTSFDREFHNDLHVLAALLPSPFVVSLLNYCLDSPHCRLLVYEYMPNGSLQDALFSSSDHHLVLSWDHRFDIVLDVAQALAFLSWDRRLGSGLGARLAHQATQTGMMRGRICQRTASIQGIRARWRDWTVGRMPFSGNQGSMPPSRSRRRNRRSSTIEIRRTGR